MKNRESKRPIGLCPDTSAAVALSRAYNKEFYESGTHLARVDGLARSSLIVDPPDGKIPALKPDAEKKFREAVADARRHHADQASDPAGRSAVFCGEPRGRRCFPRTTTITIKLCKPEHT